MAHDFRNFWPEKISHMIIVSTEICICHKYGLIVIAGQMIFFQNSTQFHIFVKFEWKWTKWTHIDTQSWSALNFDPCFLQSIRTRPPPACQRLCVHICHNPGLYFISNRAHVVSQYSGEIYSISLSFLNGFWSNWHFWIQWKIEILAVYKTCTFHIWLMRTKSDKSCLFSRQNRS